MTGDDLAVRELAPGVTLDDLRAATASYLIASPDLREVAATAPNTAH